MYKQYSGTRGIGPNVYRSRDEIKEDIRYVYERISEINEMLNIRELISEVFNQESSVDIIKKAENVTELLKYAEEALTELKSLTERLDELKAELHASADMCIMYERGDVF